MIKLYLYNLLINNKFLVKNKGKLIYTPNILYFFYFFFFSFFLFLYLLAYTIIRHLLNLYIDILWYYRKKKSISCYAFQFALIINTSFVLFNTFLFFDNCALWLIVLVNFLLCSLRFSHYIKLLCQRSDAFTYYNARYDHIWY